MSQQEGQRIVEELLAEPHIKGHRISVLQIRDEVEGRGLQPRTVASRYDLDVADVYRALAYFHEHPKEMQAIRERRQETIEEVEAAAQDHRPEDVTPPHDGE